MQGEGDAETVGQTVALLKEDAQRLGLTWQMKTATVTATNTTTGIVSARYDADTDPIPMTSMIGLPPVGARVKVLELPPSGNFVVGLVSSNASTRALGTAVAEFTVMTAGTTTSATAVAMPGSPSIGFTKKWSDTRLKFGLDCTFFASGGDAGAFFSLHTTSGIDVPVARLNAANGTNGTRQQASGRSSRPGSTFPAGAYTFTVYWFRSNGAGTLTVAVDDWLSFEIVEYEA
jgi:hypothetical protein